MRAAPSVELVSIIGRTRHLLLDFDGPICSIFAGLPAPSVAARLRELLGSNGTPLPDSVTSEDDPIEVLRFTPASTWALLSGSRPRSETPSEQPRRPQPRRLLPAR